MHIFTQCKYIKKLFCTKIYMYNSNGNCLPNGKRKGISNAQKGCKGLKGYKDVGCPRWAILQTPSRLRRTPSINRGRVYACLTASAKESLMPKRAKRAKRAKRTIIATLPFPKKGTSFIITFANTACSHPARRDYRHATRDLSLQASSKGEEMCFC